MFIYLPGPPHQRDMQSSLGMPVVPFDNLSGLQGKFRDQPQPSLARINSHTGAIDPHELIGVHEQHGEIDLTVIGFTVAIAFHQVLGRHDSSFPTPLRAARTLLQICELIS